MERSRRFHDGVGSKHSNSRCGKISPKVMAMMIRNAVAPFAAYRRWRPAADATYQSAVSRLVRRLSSQLTKDPHHLAGARARSWISTVAVMPAERTTLGDTSSMWMRTGMRWARRTQVKIGFTVAIP